MHVPVRYPHELLPGAEGMAIDAAGREVSVYKDVGKG